MVTFSYLLSSIHNGKMMWVRAGNSGLDLMMKDLTPCSA